VTGRSRCWRLHFATSYFCSLRSAITFRAPDTSSSPRAPSTVSESQAPLAARPVRDLRPFLGFFLGFFFFFSSLDPEQRSSSGHRVPHTCDHVRRALGAWTRHDWLVAYCPDGRRWPLRPQLRELRRCSGCTDRRRSRPQRCFGLIAPRLSCWRRKSGAGEAVFRCVRYIQFAPSNQFYNGPRRSASRLQPGPSVDAGQLRSRGQPARRRVCRRTVPVAGHDQLAAFNNSSFMLGHAAMSRSTKGAPRPGRSTGPPSQAARAEVGILGMAFQGDSTTSVLRFVQAGEELRVQRGGRVLL